MKNFNEIKPTNKSRKRILLVFGFFILLLFALSARIGWIQIIKADEYSTKALKQQTSDSVIAALRGDILDCNGKQLAVSVTTNTIWVRPSSVRKNGKTDELIESNARAEAASLAAILELDVEDVYTTITSEKTLVKVKKNVDADTASKIRAEKLCGIEIVEDARRSYPLQYFASHVLGFTNDDNEGQNGLELYYNEYLAGQNGRYITTKDKNSKSLIYGTSKYYDPADGYTLVTTIDEGIQYILEQKLDEYKEITGATRLIAMVMDPKTGGIKGMAQTNDYNPNEPREPKQGDDEYFSTLTNEEKVTYWYKNWRSFCISDTYEPGSTFKLITSSIALDNGAKLTDTYTCTGTIQVNDWRIRCWYYPRSHGKQTLMEAIGNSCNPSMVQLVQKLDKKNYYEGLDAFGLTGKTGIDYPGEGTNLIYSIGDAGPVEYATMSYGQGISVTPISLITAVSSLANGGKVMQPHFIDKLLDSDGNTVYQFEPVVKGISVSAQTASDMLSVMEYVVQKGGAGSAKVAGYRIGGKTGTASKPTTGGYSETDYYSSFIGVAPIDDPQFVVLVLVDTPQGKIYGSQTAAPCAGAIIEEILQYLNIRPNYSEAELAKMKSNMTEVPDLCEQTLEDAAGILAGADLTYELSPALEETGKEIIIVDQYPKAGDELVKNSAVTLYYELAEHTTLEEEIKNETD